MSEAWASIAKRKRQEQRDRIPDEWKLSPSAIVGQGQNVLTFIQASGLLSNSELHITDARDATALIGELASGRIKSADVTRAYCKRAAIATQLTNCLTEIFFSDAIARANELDSYLSIHGKPIGPLHGLPISLKDSFNVRGYDSSLGVAALCFRPAQANSPLVDLLISLGAVLYCKTNVPQTLSALDSHNNIFGRVLNPLNTALTAGGSSGGEGALLGSHGSPLGVGTDVGGSIRVPAMCNGLYGVKPSHGRVPYAGQQSSAPDGVTRLIVEPTAGPLARSLRDCVTFLRIIADSRPESVDPNVFSQAWNLQPVLTPEEPLKLGVITWDGHTRPLPCIANFMLETAQRLRRNARIELVTIDASVLLEQCVKVFNGLMSVDGGNAWFDLLEAYDEPLSPWLQNRLKRRPSKKAEVYRDLQVKRHTLQVQFLKVWQRSGGYWQTKTKSDRLDAIICPPAPHPVAPVDGWNTVNYTAAWNLLDYPAGIIPIRQVKREDLQGELESQPLNGWDKINGELWTKVDREIYLDSVLSLQVVTPKLEERKLVESMAIIAGCLDPSPGKSGRSVL